MAKEDKRLTNINNEQQVALNESENTYNSILNDANNLYNQQKNDANQYETIQNGILDKQLNNNVQKIEQQKKDAGQNFRTESNKALNDYTAYVNPYGIQNEILASQGLANSGLAVSSKDSAYTTYQDRLSKANKVYQDAITKYDQDINDARLNNDVQKAQNALAKLQMNMDFAKEYYANTSTTKQNALTNKQSVKNDYFNKYQTEYQNIQNEKAAKEAKKQWEAEMKEKKRQYDTNLAYQKERDAIADSQWQQEYALSQQAAARSSSGGGGYTSQNIVDDNEPKILETHDDGWSKTNMIQTIRDENGNLKNVEVFRNPEGQFLFWDPKNNKWVEYTGNSNSNGGYGANGSGGGGFR